jgi:hypothetical protein
MIKRCYVIYSTWGGRHATDWHPSILLSTTLDHFPVFNTKKEAEQYIYNQRAYPGFDDKIKIKRVLMLTL